MTQKYPEDSVQYYCSPWWTRSDDSQVQRGRLLWAFVPHVDQHPFVLAAPYYGADQGGTTGGWKPEFVARIRRCEYPQYMWDNLPLKGRNESILRLDHLQPIGRHGESYEVTEFQLHEDALQIVDDYLVWLFKEGLPEGSVLIDIRKEILGTS